VLREDVEQNTNQQKHGELEQNYAAAREQRSPAVSLAFRGQQPLFIRSRNLNGERTLEQEIKLSASYLRDTLRTDSVEQCYVSGNAIDAQLASIISSEFGAPVHTISLADCSDGWPEGIAAYESELAACTGVFPA